MNGSHVCTHHGSEVVPFGYERWGKECISEVVLALQGAAKESWAMQS